jgi:hypothetical protein
MLAVGALQRVGENESLPSFAPVIMGQPVEKVHVDHFDAAVKGAILEKLPSTLAATDKSPQNAATSVSVSTRYQTSIQASKSLQRVRQLSNSLQRGKSTSGSTVQANKSLQLVRLLKAGTGTNLVRSPSDATLSPRRSAQSPRNTSDTSVTSTPPVSKK